MAKIIRGGEGRQLTSLASPGDADPRVTDMEPRGPRPKRITAGRIGVYAFLIVSAIFFLMPLWIMLVTSLKSMPEIRKECSSTGRASRPSSTG